MDFRVCGNPDAMATIMTLQKERLHAWRSRKGSRKNNFTELALRFRLGSADFVLLD